MAASSKRRLNVWLYRLKVWRAKASALRVVTRRRSDPPRDDLAFRHDDCDLRLAERQRTRIGDALKACTARYGAPKASGNSLVGSAHLITKVYFPRAFIPAAAVGAGLVDLSVGAVPLLALALYYRVPVTWGLLLLPVGKAQGKRIDTASTHGTGCTLASAIALFLGHGASLSDAVARALAARAGR